VKVGAASQGGPFAYIAHQASAAPAPGIISVIDTSTGQVAATIPVGVYPAGVAVNDSGTRTYVSNAGSNTVSVIDTATNAVVATIPVGVSPLGLAVNPAGTRVYVANSGGKSVSVIDATANAVIATLNVGTTPTGVAVNQAGTRVYVTNQGDSTVSEIDVSATPNSVSSAALGSKPYGLAVAGTLVFVANGDTSTVSVIDTAASPLAISTLNVGLNPRGIAVNPAGTTVYVVNNGDRTVSVIDVATRTVTNTVAVGVTPAYVAFNPTGTLAYVVNQGDNTVSVINVTAKAAIPSAAVPVSPGGLYAFGKFMATGSAQSYLGLWWNPDESGWGMSVTQHGSMIFNAFYTYDQAGTPTWYVMSSCPLSGASCTGDIYKVTGGTAPTVAWNGAGKVVSSVGSGTLTFADANTATFSFTINGVAGSKSIVRQEFATGATQPVENYIDLWWNPDESGWGVALTQQYGMIFAAWYGYDSTGNAVWYVASSCPVAGSGCTGDLYQVTGGSPLTGTWNGANKVTAKVGTVTFTFTDASNGTMSYSINGVAGSRNITRQGF
jgi:YVTN family beta-propeller protein